MYWTSDFQRNVKIARIDGMFITGTVCYSLTVEAIQFMGF